ncbi:hypothetical protein [Psychromonas ossibalaenae]|uniref:hypothetical protein n=1 Tax=Psychromonas ossibalaenae TaxID=444922 RepID=UPI000374ECBD|nr:hypothetical protein [Psychromonas ossibalaenae]
MTSLHKQKGIALFIAMLILPLLLVLGVLVMSNTFLSLKITDARVMQGESNILLNNAVMDILHRSSSAQSFAQATDKTTFSSDEVTAKVDLDEDDEIHCKRRIQASGSNFKCKYLEVSFIHLYGRERADGSKWATNELGVGVEQPIIVDNGTAGLSADQ